MVRVVIIGMGKMGMSHCAILRAHPDVKLVAMCDTDSLLQSAFKKLTDIACYSDYRKMIDTEKPDAVYVVTPTKFHYDMVMYALKKGCHVFCEKPFSLCTKEGEEMCAYAQKSGLINQVGYHNRFIGTFNAMRQLLKSGIIGTPFHFMGEAYGPVVLKPKGGTWRSSKNTGGGCVMDYAAHVLNLINYVTGSPIIRTEGAFMPSIYSKEVDDAVYSTLILENGLRGQLSVCWSDDTYRKMTTSVKIEGNVGKLEADATTLKIYVKSATKVALELDGMAHRELVLDKGWNFYYLTDFTPQVFFNLRGEEYSMETDYFIQHIKDNSTENRNSFAESLQTDRIITQLINNN